MHVDKVSLLEMFPKNGVGVQLIIFGEDVVREFDSVARRCSELGFKHVEGNLSVMKLAPHTVRTACENHNIAFNSLHVSYDNVASSSEAILTLEFLSEVNCQKLIVSGGDGAVSASGVKAFSHRLNEIGESVAKEEVSLYYHLFDWVFKDFKGVIPYEILVDQVDTKLVKFVLDTVWVEAAGRTQRSLAQLIGKCNYVHLKDAVDPRAKPPAFCPLGDGAVDLIGCLEIIADAEHEVEIVVEQDRPVRSAEHDLKRSMDFLIRHMQEIHE